MKPERTNVNKFVLCIAFKRLGIESGKQIHPAFKVKIFAFNCATNCPLGVRNA